MKRYIIFPRPRFSKNDRDSHFISAQKLIKLYNVDRNDCILINNNAKLKGIHGIFMPLYPKFEGDYSLNNPLIKIN